MRELKLNEEEFRLQMKESDWGMVKLNKKWNIEIL